MTKPLADNLLAKIIEEKGSFALVYRRDRHLDRGGGRRVYFYFRPHLVLAMRKDKKELLEQVRSSLGCGKIFEVRNQARWELFSAKEAKRVIKVLKNHSFLNPNTEKVFQLWQEAIAVLLKYARKKINVEKGKRGFVSTWTDYEQKDLRRLFRIREEMKRYKKWSKGDYRWTHTLLARPF